MSPRTYLRHRLKAIILFCLFISVFLISFMLYRLPPEAVLYPVLLTVFIGIIILTADYNKMSKQYSELNELSKKIRLLSELPDININNDVFNSKYEEMLSELLQKLCENELKYKSDFAEMTDYYSVWAHQIKTPIASMKLLLENEDSALSRKLRSALLSIEQYAEMVLVYLRLDSETTDYVFREQDIDAIIREEIKKFKSDFITKKIRLDFSPSEIKTVTDEKWLGFVIGQIISNALKYTKAGCVSIHSNENSLYITDTGIGIAKEDIPRIFEKGYTGYNGHNEKSATGIGLYLCKKICDNLGICISVTSEINKGTTVRLDFSSKTVIKE